MQRIYLTDDAQFFTLVDDCDYEWLQQWKWGLARKRGNLYARRSCRIDGRRYTLYVHRLVMHKICPPPTDDKFVVDHIDGNGLMNTRDNLRWATYSENARNVYGIAYKQRSFFWGSAAHVLTQDPTSGKLVRIMGEQD